MIMPEDGREETTEVWERKWGVFSGTWTDREMRRASDLCSMIPAGLESVLEVGCGDGLIINRVTSPDTMGVDVSSLALSSLSGPSLQCSLESLPFEDGRYELVIASEVLEHLPDEIYRRSISEIARVARRYILVSVPDREYLKAGETRCPNCGSRYHRNLHMRSYDQRAMQGLFDGFEVATMRKIGAKEPRRTWPEVNVRSALGRGLPPPWNTVCPCCDAAFRGPPPTDQTGVPPQSNQNKVVRSAAAAAGGLVKRKAEPWIAALYART